MQIQNISPAKIGISLLGLGILSTVLTTTIINHSPTDQAEIISSVAPLKDTRDGDKALNAIKKDLVTLASKLNSRQKTGDIAKQLDDLEEKFLQLENKIEYVLQQENGVAYNTEDDTENNSNQNTRPPGIDSMEAEAQKSLDRRYYAEQQFDEGSVDPKWSAETSSLITRSIDIMPSNSSEFSYVRCQSTMCMAEVSHLDANAAEEFVLHFTSQLGAALPEINYYSNEDSDGSINMVMHLAREGHSLPQLP